MDEDTTIEELVNQTLDATLSAVPVYLTDIEMDKDKLCVENVKEFVFGVIMGMTFGLASAAIASLKDEMPSEEDQTIIRDIIYTKIPQIREKIYR